MVQPSKLPLRQPFFSLVTYSVVDLSIVYIDYIFREGSLFVDTIIILPLISFLPF